MFVEAVEVINKQLLIGKKVCQNRLSLLQRQENLAAVFQQQKRSEGGGEEHPVGIITTFSMMGLGAFVNKVAKTTSSRGL